MECLKGLIGLKGGCAEIANTSGLWLNSKVTYNELSDYIDQNDYASVDEMFTSLRSDAVDMFLAEFQTRMQDRYIARTVIAQQTLGVYKTLTSSVSTAKLKGLMLDRCTSYPNLGYRITNVGFFGNYTGNVTVLYYNGISGEALGSDTIAAVAGETVKLNVNRLFNVQDLIVVYDATGIDGYETKIDCYLNGCIACTRFRVNTHTTARPITATIGSPLTNSYASELGGLIVDVSMECDNTSWLCGIKQQLAMPILFKLSELVMEYAISNSGRGNTRTMRDIDRIKERHGYYKDEFEKYLDLALKRAMIPNDPICFDCKKRDGIYVAIP